MILTIESKQTRCMDGTGALLKLTCALKKARSLVVTTFPKLYTVGGIQPNVAFTTITSLGQLKIAQEDGVLNR